jgi:hypothetical protein
VEVCNGRYGTQEGWLGMSRLYFDVGGEHIEAATVQMNDSFFDTGSDYYNDAARQHTMCHELGHTAGLDHIDNGSCMNDSRYAVFNQVAPTNKDFNQLAHIHGHSDATTTVAGDQGTVTKAKAKKAKSKKDRKGKHRKRGKNDRRQHTRGEGTSRSPITLETVTVETLEDGRQVVTFSTWAQDPSVPAA